jgi:HTH-like domain
MRVTRSRELVAAGYRPAVVARVAQISRQAIYRVPKSGRAPASPDRPSTDEVEAAIVDVATKNPTDGYRLVTAWVRRRLGRPVNRKRVLRVMRERRLIQRRRPLPRRRRPGFFHVQRPDQLWHLDMTSVWVAEHGGVYLMAATGLLHARDHRLASRDPLPSQGGHHTDRTCRRRARHPARQPDAGHRQRLGVHRPRLQDRPRRPGHRPSPRGLPRPREPGVHRILVRQAQGALRLARRVRDPRPGPGADRRLRRPLPPPAALTAGLPHAARTRGDLERWRNNPPNPSGLTRQHGRGARQCARWRRSWCA